MKEVRHVDRPSAMPTVCNIGMMSECRSAIRLGWFCAVALLYIEGLLVLMALVGGAISFALLGAVLLGAAWPVAFKGARVIQQTSPVYRLVALALAFVVVMGAGWGIEIPARIFFALLLLSLSGLVVVATRKVASIVRKSGNAADTTVLEYCLFGDPLKRRPYLENLSTPRLRRATPWFAGAVALVGLGIAISEMTDRGFVVLFAIPAAYLFHRGRRHMAPPASEAKRADSRPPTLMLRSFQDDRIKVERFSLVPRRSFEQIVAPVLKSVGPPIIVGDPGEPLPRLGALREYIASDDWQTAVARLIDDVALLVFVLGDTENLFWEFQRAISKRRQADVLIIVPPLGRQVLQSRWQRFFSDNANALDGSVPPQFPSGPVIGVFFAANDPAFIVSRKRSVNDYQLAIRLFLRLQREKLKSPEELAGFLRAHLPMVQCVS